MNEAAGAAQIAAPGDADDHHRRNMHTALPPLPTTRRSPTLMDCGSCEEERGLRLAPADPRGVAEEPADRTVEAAVAERARIHRSCRSHGRLPSRSCEMGGALPPAFSVWSGNPIAAPGIRRESDLARGRVQRLVNRPGPPCGPGRGDAATCADARLPPAGVSRKEAARAPPPSPGPLGAGRGTRPAGRLCLAHVRRAAVVCRALMCRGPPGLVRHFAR